MYEQANYPVPTLEGAAKSRKPDLTLRQNIDQQIENAEKRVEELKAIKGRLDSTGLIDSRIDDLQQAMRW